MYSDNSMSKNSGKLPTLDAAITLSNKFDDRTKKRTYFVTENGEKKQMIEKDVKNLIPNVAKCIGGIKVFITLFYKIVLGYTSVMHCNIPI